jgi:hypothetical protein
MNNPTKPTLVASKDRLILSSREFAAGFRPPDYIIDGIIQARFLYSLTGHTGSGKTAIMLLLAAHVAVGRAIAGNEVKKGRVLYFAGENPDDTLMRWIAMSTRLGFDLDDISVHFVRGVVNIAAMLEQAKAEAMEVRGYDLICVDTSAAYFFGEEANSNTQMLTHAKVLRSLTTLPGGPAVIAACHPTKGASNDNLVPYGGGAFVNEVDGNLTCAKTDNVVDLHWQRKYRGVEFEPIGFQLSTVHCDDLHDSSGRSIPTVMASVVTEKTRTELAAKARRDEDAVLVLLQNGGGSSVAKMGEALGWIGRTNQPQKSRVQGALKKLQEAKLATDRDGWEVTKQGKEAARKAQ